MDRNVFVDMKVREFITNLMSHPGTYLRPLPIARYDPELVNDINRKTLLALQLMDVKFDQLGSMIRVFDLKGKSDG